MERLGGERIIDRFEADARDDIDDQFHGWVGGIFPEVGKALDLDVDLSGGGASAPLYSVEVLDGTGVTVGISTATAGLAGPKGCITFVPRAPWERSGQLSVLLQWRGLQESTDGVAAGDDVCGDGEDAGSDGYRRQVTVSTFVIDGTEL